MSECPACGDRYKESCAECIMRALRRERDSLTTELSQALLELEAARSHGSALLRDVEHAEAQRDQALRERDAWIETAQQHCRDKAFYHGLVTAIGERFGDAAKTSDDGSLQQDVLALAVPDLVGQALRELGEARAALLDLTSESGKLTAAILKDLEISNNQRDAALRSTAELTRERDEAIAELKRLRHGI